MKLTDTHCHLYFAAFEDDLHAVLARAWDTGIQYIMVPGIDLETSLKAIELAESDPRIFASVGIHPNSATTWTAESLNGLKNLAVHPKVLAIGEIGLDFYRDYSPPDLQRNVLLEQLQLASETNLPVIIHNRSASDILYPILLDWSKNRIKHQAKQFSKPGVLHSYNSDHQLVDQLIQAGFYFGISGPVTFKNAISLSSTVARLPLDRILLETDAPFLSPQPFRGKRNEPAYTIYVVQKIAEIKSISPTELSDITFTNANRLFSWSNNR